MADRTGDILLGIDGELTNLLDTGGRWVHELAASPVSGLVAAAVVANQALHSIAPAAALPGDETPRSYLAGDPWQGSGPS